MSITSRPHRAAPPPLLARVDRSEMAIAEEYFTL
jgi:hypothetical protein